MNSSQNFNIQNLSEPQNYTINVNNTNTINANNSIINVNGNNSTINLNAMTYCIHNNQMSFNGRHAHNKKKAHNNTVIGVSNNVNNNQNTIFQHNQNQNTKNQKEDKTLDFYENKLKNRGYIGDNKKRGWLDKTNRLKQKINDMGKMDDTSFHHNICNKLTPIVNSFSYRELALQQSPKKSSYLCPFGNHHFKFFK